MFYNYLTFDTKKTTKPDLGEACKKRTKWYGRILGRNKSAVLTFGKTERDSKLFGSVRNPPLQTLHKILRSFQLTQPHDKNQPKYRYNIYFLHIS